MAKTKSQIRLDLAPNEIHKFKFDNYDKVSKEDLSALGIGMDSALMPDVTALFSRVAMDASLPLQTTPTITNPVQFFQYWAPEAVEVVTAARKIDEIVGRTIAGSFEDEEIVTTILERTGSAQPYTDTANIPFASWNQSFETRSIVRFEEGLQVGYLEAMRASRMRIDSHKEKVAAVGESLAIELNNVGFYGYADGTNKTYGFLNDPNLTAYKTVATGAAGGTTWASKTFLEITADIITAVGDLVMQLQGNFDPTSDNFTLALPLSATQWLNKMNELGTKSVSAWLRDTYPNLKLVAAPQLDGANGDSNVFYMNIERVGAADVMKQYVQDVMRLIGVEKKAKVVVEDYANATAGIIVQQPLGAVRYSGI